MSTRADEIIAGFEREGEEKATLNVESCYDVITHRCDGPLTPFVLISRAIAFGGENMPDALHDALTERGWLTKSEDAIEPTGS